MVAGEPTDVAIELTTPAVEDEDATLLEAVTLGFPLDEPAPERSRGLLQGLPERAHAAVQARNSVGFEGRVGVERRTDVEVLGERFSHGWSAVAHEHQISGTLFDLFRYATHLRGKLAAKQSPKVPKEDQHHRAVFPERADRCWGSGEGEHLDLGER